MTATCGVAAERVIKSERGTRIWSEPLSGGGRAVVKMYRHRGIADPLRRWFVPYRAEREYRLLQRLSARGLPCPEPLSWSHGSDRGNGRFETLSTREIEGVLPLSDRLRAGTAPDLAPLFALARRMHEAGVAHGAFYPANILVADNPGDAGTFYLIDLAHGCRFSRDLGGRRPAEFDLLDLLRGVARIVPLAAPARWLAAYGVDGATSRRLLGRFERHRLERPWRHFRRMETDTREALDCWLHPGARDPGA